ncbi:MAG TPA: fumarylacetoacetase, partial [Burkholderiaceae bacterium]
MIDFTHDAGARSWVESANAPDTDFPIQNLPFGRFRRAGTHGPLRIGVAIGREVLDLHALGQLDPQVAVLLGPLAHGDLNGFMGQGRAACIALRHALFSGLSAQPLGTASLWRAKADTLLVPQDEAEMALPCRIGDYTDFYTG